MSVSIEWQSDSNIMGGGGGERHSNVETLADVSAFLL